MRSFYRLRNTLKLSSTVISSLDLFHRSGDWCFVQESTLWSILDSLYLQCSFQPRLSARFKITLQSSSIFRNFSVYIQEFSFLYERIFILSECRMVDSMSSWSSLEITRNPFDNGREERTNCPGFSPSMFCHQETPESQKVRKFVLDRIRRNACFWIPISQSLMSHFILLAPQMSQKRRTFRWSIEQISRLVSYRTLAYFHQPDRYIKKLCSKSIISYSMLQF